MNFSLTNVCRTITLLAVLLAGHRTTSRLYDFNTTTGGSTKLSCLRQLLVSVNPFPGLAVIVALYTSTTTGGTSGKIKIKRDNNEEYPSIDQVATNFKNYFIRAQEGKPRDILLIVDGSGSVDRSELEITKRGVRHIINSTCGGFGPEPAQNRLAIMQFSSNTKVKHPFFAEYQNRESIDDGVNAFHLFRQYTCVGKALRKGHLVFQGKYGARNYTVHDTLVITNGISSCRENSHEASQFLQQRSSVYVVAIGMASDLQEMKNIVSNPSFLFSLPTYGDFLKMTQEAEAMVTKEECPR